MPIDAAKPRDYATVGNGDDAAAWDSDAVSMEAGKDGGGGDEVPTSAELGLIVSRRVGVAEQDLLYWNRFRIVAGPDVRVDDFICDIDHIRAAHLEPQWPDAYTTVHEVNA